MSYTLDTNAAKAADNFASSIRESGKYIGTITRAEDLLSANGTKGIGLSFKSEDGATADYLDLYTHKADGEALSSLKTVNAIMACLKLRGIAEGPISFEKWDASTKQRVRINGKGYPELMNKKVGLLLRKFIDSKQDGSDRDGVEIFGVFQADTELTATEVLNQATKPERLSKMLDALIARPVYDKRKKATSTAKASSSAGEDWTQDQDIPF